ncbi:hypothetical protein JNW87_18270, partial [Micromonospora sp. ATA51]|nr:hypothetical protein [Micromonospora sp. ATA51]
MATAAKTTAATPSSSAPSPSGMFCARRREPVPAEVYRPLAVVPPDRTLADLLLSMR